MEPAPLASLDALRRAAATLSEAKDLAALFEEVGDEVPRVVHYHTMRLFLLDEAANELYPVAIRSFVEDYDLAGLSATRRRPANTAGPAWGSSRGRSRAGTAATSSSCHGERRRSG